VCKKNEYPTATTNVPNAGPGDEGKSEPDGRVSLDRLPDQKKRIYRDRLIQATLLLKRMEEELGHQE
jgi:hypothetical protein